MSPAVPPRRSRAGQLSTFLRFVLIALIAMALGAFITWRVMSHLG